MMKAISRLSGFTYTIQKLNIAMSFVFLANGLIRSTLLSLVFFILWDILLYKLFVKQRKEKKYLFSYFFIAALIGVFFLKAGLVINLYHRIV
ncbi:hypothetical protein Amet_1819 [Alkaliphilus metalliredigens QYMF]|uniref:Uncharacterized protein n=1 Tax=Alkaliphilus metalliredigens (strain QYMF) TaxID=293826 RepID=A6TP71_ALKMQ|nr:hypothetical protein [Alkaliphilus metalliredigens]ABR47989.1 hypothetical protein Amet_1819 [Alkaliphilus metalliredigens QYMF]